MDGSVGIVDGNDVHRMRKNDAIVMLTRAPLPGRAKTRMMPDLDARECADFQRALLRDAAVLCRDLSSAMDVCIAYAPEGCESAIRRSFDIPAEYFMQKGNDIGERMFEAARHVFSDGYERCVLVGSDTPELEAGNVFDALSLLDQSDAAFIPSTDGGYCLVALKNAEKSLFSLESYGHEEVLRQTLDAAAAAGLSVSLLPAMGDIDYWSDAVELLARAEADPSKQRLESVRFLQEIEASR